MQSLILGHFREIMKVCVKDKGASATGNTPIVLMGVDFLHKVGQMD